MEFYDKADSSPIPVEGLYCEPDMEEERGIFAHLEAFASGKQVDPWDISSTAPKQHQVEGVEWLLARRQGILADDMGLGKTLQLVITVCHLLRRRAATETQSKSAKTPEASLHPKALIITPKSLVSHWREEFHRHLHAEYRPVIGTRFQHLCTSDILILSYNQWRLQHLKQSREDRLATSHPFEVVVLDEAHMIRNSNNQCCSSVLSVNARHRFCLTGTPINNSLDDLLTLCRFLRVAPYHQLTWWKQNEKDEQAMAHWRRRFFLRREKSILQLDPPTEETIHIQFSPEERTIYEEVLRGLVVQYDACLLNRAGEKNKLASKPAPLSSTQLSHLLVLTLRLRQWCNHPRLALPSSKIASSKTQRLKQELEQLIETHGAGRKRNRAGNRRLDPARLRQFPKTVIFSQWSGYLDLIEEEVLRPLGLPFLRLDGQLTSEQRGNVVRQFQRLNPPDEATVAYVPIFLATTKAGGLGLNLTEASQVFLMDYWFNPFVDLQAVNRVHRIGQKQMVKVVRFEVLDTLETQIRKLQLHKERQAAQILSTDSVAKLSEGEETGYARGSLSLLQLGRLLGKAPM